MKESDLHMKGSFTNVSNVDDNIKYILKKYPNLSMNNYEEFLRGMLVDASRYPCIDQVENAKEVRVFKTKKNRLGLVNLFHDGFDFLTEDEFTKIYYVVGTSFFKVCKNGKYAILGLYLDYIHPRGLCSEYFDDIYEMSEGFFGFKKDGKYGFIQFQIYKGWNPCIKSYVIEPKYDNITSFSEGLAAVKVENKWGFINKFGELVIECQFDDVSNFSQGQCCVKFNEEWGIIDLRGNYIVHCCMASICDVSENDFSYYLVEKNSKYGILDRKGSIILPAVYEEAPVYSEGLFCVEKDGKLGVYDVLGNIVIPYIYDIDYPEEFHEGFCLVNDGIIDNQGRLVFPTCLLEQVDLDYYKEHHYEIDEQHNIVDGCMYDFTFKDFYSFFIKTEQEKSNIIKHKMIDNRNQWREIRDGEEATWEAFMGF